MFLLGEHPLLGVGFRAGSGESCSNSWSLGQTQDSGSKKFTSDSVSLPFNKRIPVPTTVSDLNLGPKTGSPLTQSDPTPLLSGTTTPHSGSRGGGLPISLVFLEVNRPRDPCPGPPRPSPVRTDFDLNP